MIHSPSVINTKGESAKLNQIQATIVHHYENEILLYLRNANCG